MCVCVCVCVCVQMYHPFNLVSHICSLERGPVPSPLTSSVHRHSSTLEGALRCIAHALVRAHAYVLNL